MKQPAVGKADDQSNQPTYVSPSGGQGDHLNPDAPAPPFVIAAGDFYRTFFWYKKLLFAAATGFVKPVVDVPVNFVTSLAACAVSCRGSERAFVDEIFSAALRKVMAGPSPLKMRSQAGLCAGMPGAAIRFAKEIATTRVHRRCTIFWRSQLVVHRLRNKKWTSREPPYLL
jgi:hypothetical protein